MKLREISVHNFRSLRNVSLKPSPLCVLVGPNASGKTNCAEALGFLGEA